jgi:hypothetical protein
MKRFISCICVALLGSAVIPSISARVVEETLSFEIGAFPVDHQGPQVIDVVTDLTYREGIGDKEYPDFEEVRAGLIAWMKSYPNETDYWEVFVRVLAERILEEYPMVARAGITLKVHPTFSIQYPHTSRCVVVQED